MSLQKFFSLRSLILIVLVAVFFSNVLLADNPTAGLTGTVTDSSGDVVPSVQIKIQNIDIGITRTTTTNEAGVYLIIGLQAGRYVLEASYPKFNTVELKNVLLRVGDEVRVDLTLSPAGGEQTVEVTEAAPLAQTESSTDSTVVNERAIEELPTNGRQLQNLALLVPGVSAGWNLSTAANRYGKARENTEGAFAVNGARSRSNNFVFDGMPMNLRQYSVINFEPSNEAVQEFELKTSIPNAEFGRTMGGTVNIVTRSGSSRFHGSAYEFLRNDRLDANDTFNNRAGLARGKVRQHQFGGSIGGPLWKQKHFFFANVEFLRNLEASETRVTSVPTPDERRGLLRYIDARGTPQVLDLSSRITPLSQKLLGLYPQPNSAGPSGLNYNAALAIGLNDYQFHVRTDHQLTDRDIVNVRASWNLNDQIYIINRFGGPFIPGFPLVNPEKTGNGTVGYYHTFNPHLVNEFRAGLNRYSNNLGNGDTHSVAELGLPNGNNANGIPSFIFTAGSLEQLGGQPWFNREQNELTLFFSDAVSYLRGRHNFKFGGELSRMHFNTRGAFNQRGTVSFDGSQNGIIPLTDANARAAALADFLLGKPFAAAIVVGQFGRGYRQWAYAGYAQDTWRVNNRLTLNFGLRYEYAAPWTEVNNKLSNFVPGRGIVTPQTPGFDGLYRPNRNNLAPRAGFAYDLTGHGRTVLRGGFGILYETLLQASTVQQVENNAPFSASAITFTPTPFAADGSPSRTLLDLRNSARPSRSLGTIPQDLRNPYSLQFSLNIQHVLGRDWLVEAGYEGTHGVRLPLNYNINQVPIASLAAAQRQAIQQAIGSAAGTGPIIDPLRPYPDFDSINLFDNAAVSSYHSLQLKLEKRMSSGLNLLAAYTFSKAIDNASDFDSGDSSEHVLNSQNLHAQRGVSSFDIPHRFTAAFNYELPRLRPWGDRLGLLLNGWQLNGNLTLQSGQPFTPYLSAFDPFRNEGFNRPDVVGDPNRDVPPGFAFNPAAFRAPQIGSFGNAGRNIVRGDGFKTVDLSLFRNFTTYHEHLHTQFRLETINLFNTVNFQGPVTNLSTTPGVFVASASPRVLQLGVKLSF